MNCTAVRYVTSLEDYNTFGSSLASNCISTLDYTDRTEANILDEELQGKVKQYNTEDLTQACFFMCNSSM
jgi:hypothetical protein